MVNLLVNEEPRSAEAEDETPESLRHLVPNPPSERENRVD